jgi:hypothetical protein
VARKEKTTYDVVLGALQQIATVLEQLFSSNNKMMLLLFV